MKIDGISAIAVLLIASFAIERAVTGLLVLLSFLRIWSRYFPDPPSIEDATARAKAERKQKVAYFLLAAPLAILVMCLGGKILIFQALGFETNVILDGVMTGLILVAGAEFLANDLKLSGGFKAAAPAEKPVVITGNLVLEDKATAPPPATDSIRT